MPKLCLESDPQAVVIERVTPGKLILGLDLGTTTGYAYSWLDTDNNIPANKRLFMGQWDLSAGPYDSGAIRFVRLRQFLATVRPALVGFEDVKYTPAQKANKFTIGAILARAATACEWFGALKATLCTWCEENDIPCIGIPIGSIKKRATARGNANKEDMIKACNDEFGTDFGIEDYNLTGADNIADAAWVCQLVMEQHAEGM